MTGAGTAEGTGAQSQPKEWKTLVEEKGAASAGMGEVSPEQGDFPARCSGALREGMSGLAPACRARLCWDAQEEDCESRAILPWGSPSVLWALTLLFMSPCLCKGDLGVLRENQVS